MEKITSNITPLEQVNKINGIIDEIQPATSSSTGVVQPDNVSIVVQNGVISSLAGTPPDQTFDGTSLKAQSGVAVNQAITNLLSLVYPVGSLYIGTQSYCPLVTLISGSEWELVGQDRALWGGNGSNANTNIEQSLPNHRHTLTLQTRHGQSGSTYNTAYFSDGNTQTTQTNMTGTTSYASASNPIYGGTRVQPPAYRVNLWRRTA